MNRYQNKLFEKAANIIKKKRKIKILNVDYHRAIIMSYTKLGRFLDTKTQENTHILGLYCLSLKEISIQLYEDGFEEKKPQPNTVGRRLLRLIEPMAKIFEDKYNSGELDVESELQYEKELQLRLIDEYHGPRDINN